VRRDPRLGQPAPQAMLENNAGRRVGRPRNQPSFPVPSYLTFPTIRVPAIVSQPS
jgi:hypothetical protein